MAVNEYQKILLAGTQAQYDALATKDSSKVYFCTDTGKLYRGEVDFTDSTVVVAEKPAAPLAGKIYFITSSNTVESYVGGQWRKFRMDYVTSKAGGGTGIDNTSTDDTLATAKAVWEAIEEYATSGDAVKNIVQTTTTDPETSVVTKVPGSLTITKTDDSTSTLNIEGLLKTPVWDGQARTLTFPNTDGTSYVANIGKDIFIDETANNRYENGNIYLYLNDGTQSSNPTEIVIPVTGLITDYFGDDTDSISVDIDNSTHEVTARVNIRPDSAEVGSEFTNALKCNASGMYVDLSAYTPTSGVEALVESIFDITGMKSTIAANTANISTNTANIAANASSIAANAADIANHASSIAQNATDIAANASSIAQNATDIAANASSIAALESTVSTISAQVAENTANIAGITNAWGWGTFA